MLSIALKQFSHQHFFGGIGVADILVRKRTVDCSRMDNESGPQRDIKRDTHGEMCLSCVSCSRGKCFFSFPSYPKCHLLR
jgi:hypothetical protein